jgi:hypothetical protein
MGRGRSRSAAGHSCRLWPGGMPASPSPAAEPLEADHDDPRSENRPLRHDRSEAPLKILCIAIGFAIALAACAKQGPGIRAVQHTDGALPSVVIAKP